jgi:hypothetical protein
MTVNRSQLVQAVTESTDVARHSVEVVVESLFDTIISEVRSEGDGGRFRDILPDRTSPSHGTEPSNRCSGTDPSVERSPVRHRFDVQIGVDP